LLSPSGLLREEEEERGKEEEEELFCQEKAIPKLD
jgi:hypothetical protein